ncbi:MAG TPA: hypothetical protein VHK69_06010, partial [Chitinophagaceae bacterium]|nr:hypothetical protein [Chitinophagaceae bacterium]
MKANLLKFLCGALLPLISLTAAAQCAYVPLSLAQRTQTARSIAIGKVVEQQTYMHTTGHVYTLNKVQVNAWLKSGSTATEAYVITMGGRYGNK